MLEETKEVTAPLAAERMVLPAGRRTGHQDGGSAPAQMLQDSSEVSGFWTSCLLRETLPAGPSISAGHLPPLFAVWGAGVAVLAS